MTIDLFHLFHFAGTPLFLTVYNNPDEFLIANQLNV